MLSKTKTLLLLAILKSIHNNNQWHSHSIYQATTYIALIYSMILSLKSNGTSETAQPQNKPHHNNSIQPLIQNLCIYS